MVGQQTNMTLDVKAAVEGVVAAITGIVTEIETTVTVIEIGQDVDTLLAEGTKSFTCCSKPFCIPYHRSILLAS